MPDTVTTYELRFDRKPKAKERPRLGRRRKAFTPAATLEWEADLAWAWGQQDFPVLEGPVAMEMEFHKEEVVVRVTELPEDSRSRLRGDVDNYVKIVLDGLNEVAYLDDRQVVLMTAAKVY